MPDVVDEPLKADARHNLELAKILWNEAPKNSREAGHAEREPAPRRSLTNPPKPSGNDQRPARPKRAMGTLAGTQLKTSPPAKRGTHPRVPRPTPPQTPDVPGTRPTCNPLQDTSGGSAAQPRDTREHLNGPPNDSKRDRHDLLKNALRSDPTRDQGLVMGIVDCRGQFEHGQRQKHTRRGQHRHKPEAQAEGQVVPRLRFGLVSNRAVPPLAASGLLSKPSCPSACASGLCQTEPREVSIPWLGVWPPLVACFSIFNLQSSIFNLQSAAILAQACRTNRRSITTRLRAAG